MKLTTLIRRYLCDGNDGVQSSFSPLDNQISRSTSCSSFISRIFTRSKSVQPLKQEAITPEYNVNQKCSCVICTDRNNFLLSEKFSASQVECKRKYDILNEDVCSCGSSTTLFNLSFTPKAANCGRPSEFREFPTSFSDPFGAVVFNPNNEFTNPHPLETSTDVANRVNSVGQNHSKDTPLRYMNRTAAVNTNPWFSYPGSQSEKWRHSIKCQTKDANQFVCKSMTDSGIFVNSDSSVPEKQQCMTTEIYTPNLCRLNSPTVRDSSYIQLNADPPPSPAPQGCLMRLADVANFHMGYVPVEHHSRVPFDRCPLAASGPNDFSFDPQYKIFQTNLAEQNSDPLQRHDLDESMSSKTSDFEDPICGELLNRGVKDGGFHFEGVKHVLESEQKTAKIRWRSREQVDILERMRIDGYINKSGGIPYNRQLYKHAANLKKNLEILEEAKNVINRQMQFLREAYIDLIKGQLSLQSIETLNSISPMSTSNLRRSLSYQGPIVSYIHEYDIHQNRLLRSESLFECNRWV